MLLCASRGIYFVACMTDGHTHLYIGGNNASFCRPILYCLFALFEVVILFISRTVHGNLRFDVEYLGKETVRDIGLVLKDHQ